MKNEKYSKFLDVLISIAFIFSNVLLAYRNNSAHISDSLFFVIIIGFQVLFGIFVFCFAFQKTKKTYHFFLSLCLIIWGITTLLIFCINSVSFGMAWPLYVIIAGILLIISGFIKYTKIKFGFLIPGFSLMCMGIWYALFSFRIIKIPFLTVVGFLGPVFILFLAVILILYFCAQQKNKKLVFNDEETGDYSEEFSDSKE